MSTSESSSLQSEEDDTKDPNYVDWKNMENIRVICRFRPINSREIREEKSAHLVDSPPEITDGGRCVKLTRLGLRAHAGPMEFYLDSILGIKTPQQSLYLKVGKPMVEACLEGYNTTIFAYGQTGSGKTYTMFGPEKRKSNNELGCVQRCISFLFTTLQQKVAKQTVTEWKVVLYFAQLYREKLLDLLDPDKGIPLKIRYNPETDSPYVPNLKQVDVRELVEVIKLLSIANKNRIVDKTLMNDVSSRSHMLMTMTIEQTLKEGTVTKSKLNFVDLAGSETFEKALGGTRGPINRKKLEELKTINLSLTSLTTCINYLSKGRNPSYRSSQLTFYLMDSLGGNSKTTLVVAASPHIFNRSETIRTLQFAKTAKSVKNKAKVNAELSKAQLKALVKKLQRENKKLKAKLALFEAELIKNGIDVPVDSEKKRQKRSKSMRMIPISTDIMDIPNHKFISVTPQPKTMASVPLSTLTESTVDQITYNGDKIRKKPFGTVDESAYNKLKSQLKSMQDELAQQEIEANILNDQLQKKNQMLRELTEEVQSSRNISSQLDALYDDKQQLVLELEDTNNDVLHMKQEIKRQREEFMTDKVMLDEELNDHKSDLQQYETIMDSMKLSNEQLKAEVASLRERMVDLTETKDEMDKKDAEETNKANLILSKYFTIANTKEMNHKELEDTEKKIETLTLSIVDVTKAYETFTGDNFSLNPDLTDDDYKDETPKSTPKVKASLSIDDRMAIFGGSSLKRKRRRKKSKNKVKEYTESMVKTDRKKNIVFETERLTHYLKNAMTTIDKQKRIHSEEMDTMISNLAAENKKLKSTLEVEGRDKDTEIKRLKKEIFDLKLAQQSAILSVNMNEVEDEPVDDELFGFDDQLQYLENIGKGVHEDDEDMDEDECSMNGYHHNRNQIAVWRQQLEIGSKLDCLDEACLWWTATVTDCDGFKVKVRYDGFDARWDEWMDRGSTRLARYLNKAKGGRESKGVSVNLKVIGKRKDKRTGKMRRIYKQGFLVKQGKRIKSYRTRYFVLMDDGTMEYYKKMTDDTPQGTFNIKNMIETRRIAYPNKKDLYGFEIVTAQRTWRFQAHSDDVVADWIGVIHAISQGVEADDDDVNGVQTVIYSGYDKDYVDINMNVSTHTDINTSASRPRHRRGLSVQEESSSHPPINRAAFSQLLLVTTDEDEEKEEKENGVNKVPRILISNGLNNKSRPESPITPRTPDDELRLSEKEDDFSVQHSGWMHKAGKWDANWTYRYCVLLEEEDDVTLRCYVSPNKKQTHCIQFEFVKSCIELKVQSDIYRRLEIPTAFAFQLITSSRIYTFACKSRHDVNVWLKKIRKVVHLSSSETISSSKLSKRSSIVKLGSTLNKLGTSFGRLIGVTPEHVTTTEVLKTENVEIQNKFNNNYDYSDAANSCRNNENMLMFNNRISVNGIAQKRRYSQPIMGASWPQRQNMMQQISHNYDYHHEFQDTKKGRRKSAPNLSSFKSADIIYNLDELQTETTNINDNIAAVLQNVDDDSKDHSDKSDDDVDDDDLSFIE